MTAELKVGDIIHCNGLALSSDHPLYNMDDKDLIVTEVSFKAPFTYFKIDGIPNPFTLNKMWCYIPPFKKIEPSYTSIKKWYHGYS